MPDENQSENEGCKPLLEPGESFVLIVREDLQENGLPQVYVSTWGKDVHVTYALGMLERAKFALLNSGYMMLSRDADDEELI